MIIRKDQKEGSKGRIKRKDHKETMGFLILSQCKPV